MQPPEKMKEMESMSTDLFFGHEHKIDLSRFLSVFPSKLVRQTFPQLLLPTPPNGGKTQRMDQ